MEFESIDEFKKEFYLMPRIQRLYFIFCVFGIILFFFGGFAGLNIINTIGLLLFFPSSILWLIIECLKHKGYKFKK